MENQSEPIIPHRYALDNIQWDVAWDASATGRRGRVKDLMMIGNVNKPADIQFAYLVTRVQTIAGSTRG